MPQKIITNYHLLDTFGSTQFFLKDFYLTLLVRGNAWRCLQLFKRHDGELDIGGDGHGRLLLKYGGKERKCQFWRFRFSNCVSPPSHLVASPVELEISQLVAH